MNRSNYQYPPNPENCCCYCPRKRDYTPRGGRGAKYAESSPSEDDEDEDECECGNRTYRNTDKTFARDEVYDNLIDLIDDQMMSTMSTLRKKARKFMKSELEQSFSSDTTNRRCYCSEDNRSKDTSVVKKANEIDYQPQSTFLKKMVQQYQYKQSDCSELNESDSPAAVEKYKKSKKKEENLSKAQPSPNGNQKEKPPDSCCCKCPKHNPPNCEQEHPQKKSEHVSRGKKKSKCRGKRKRRSGGKCESGDRFEPGLKQPHENSCERCWRFASPSRSPVNKPDQRYDPNFRRGHSCMSLGAEKSENLPEEEKNTGLSACKDPQSILATPDASKNVVLTPLPKRKPKMPMQDKSVQLQNPPCEDYSPLFTPLDKGTPLRSQSNEHSKAYGEARAFDFEYPSLWSAETLRTPHQKCAPRPHSCGKVKEKDSLEKGIIYSSKVRNLLTRPQSYIPATCTNNAEEEYHGSQHFKDACGRGRLQNLDPCTKRSPSVKKEDPCQGMDMSTLRGDNSRGSGLGSGLNASGGSGLDTGRDDFDQSAQSDIRADQDSALNDSSQKTSSRKKGDDDKDKSSGKKPSSGNKSPKSKSPSKTPRGSPGGSKDRKGLRDGQKGTCSTNEAQAYFKIPEEPKPPEKCGVSHPVRNCRCYPRVIDNDQDDFCCHCDEKNEPRRVNEIESSRPNENFCSPRSAFPEHSSFQGRRPCPTPSHGFNQKPTPGHGFSQKPTLPNIDEYPEQLFDLSMNGGNNGEMTLPCPYRSYMNKRPLSNSADMNDSRCQRSTPRNGNCSFRDGNASYRNGNRNVSHMGGNENCPRYGNGNMSFGNYNMSSQMNPECGMEYPRKYCVMYMTKGKENTGDDVEVLVEELTQPCPQEKDGRMTNVSEKMTRMFKCPTESMALRFQKGVSARSNVPQKSRMLYF